MANYSVAGVGQKLLSPASATVPDVPEGRQMAARQSTGYVNELNPLLQPPTRSSVHLIIIASTTTTNTRLRQHASTMPRPESQN